MRHCLRQVVLCAAACALPLLSSAGTTPDLGGIYQILGGPAGPPASDPDAAGLQPLNPDHGAAASARLLPWAREKMLASSNYSAIDDGGAVCQLAGMFRHPTTVAGWMVLQQPGEIDLVSLDLVQVGVRRIYLTDRHPAYLSPSWDGQSIGHWDEQTLVVDTIGFNDKSWLGTELQPHSEELHVSERIRTVRHGEFLEIETTVDDRKALSAPYAYSRYYKRSDQAFEDLALPCNAEQGEQATWAFMRRQAIEQFDRNRAAARTQTGSTP